MQEQYDVVVVGAGPAGSTAARFAAEAGVSVLMLEKDRDVGYPVRCAEAVSREGVEQFIEPDENWIAAHIDHFSLTSPDGSEVVLPIEQEGFMLERRMFDYALAEKAAAAGAQIVTRAYVNGLLFEGDRITGVKYEYRGEQREVRARVVIAADGVESRVGRWAGLETTVDFRDMECCAQVTAAGIEVDPSTLYFYFGSDVAPLGYFWVFPKGPNKANIGLGVSGMTGKKNSALHYLNKFMQERYPDAATLTQIAGGVPCSLTLKQISAPGVLLVGDAARQVNPLSGGGIASGMIGGMIGGQHAAIAVKQNKPELVLEYDAAWNNRLGKRHEIFDRLKNSIFNFSDEKFNDIAHAVLKVPYEKRNLSRVFRTALFNKPSLLLDVAKVFISARTGVRK